MLEADEYGATARSGESSLPLQQLFARCHIVRRLNTGDLGVCSRLPICDNHHITHGLRNVASTLQLKET